MVREKQGVMIWQGQCRCSKEHTVRVAKAADGKILIDHSDPACDQLRSNLDTPARYLRWLRTGKGLEETAE